MFRERYRFFPEIFLEIFSMENEEDLRMYDF